MKNQTSARILSSVLAASCWLGQQSWAQAAAQNPASQPTATPGSVQVGNNPQAQDKTAGKPSATEKAASAQQSAASSQAGGTSSPSPVTPQPVTNYPNAAGTDQQSPPAQTSSLPAAPQPKAQPTEPQGAATAEKVATAGGAAAKPTGVAIAPARQHRTRSILIKVGALAAIGAAAGTVYALSRGTSSVPPGSNSPIAIPK